MEKNGNYYFIERVFGEYNYAIVAYGKFLIELPRYDASLGVSDKMLSMLDTRIIFEITERSGSRKVEASGRDCFKTLDEVWAWYDKHVSDSRAFGSSVPRLVFGESCLHAEKEN